MEKPDCWHEEQRDAAPNCGHCDDNGCEQCRKHNNRDEWNNKYASILQNKTGCTGQFALDCAENADDAYNDDMTPENAVYEELSCWSE